MTSSIGTGQEERQRIKQEAAAWYAKMKSPQDRDAAEPAFKQWLLQNPLHELAYEQCCAIWEMTASLREDDEIQQELADARAPVVAIRPRRFSVSILMQMAAAVLLAVGFLFINFNQSDSIYSTQIGEHRLIRLDDGSTAMLNTGTVIAVNYSGDKRSIELREGEAYFDVVKDQERPFEVLASGSIVRALGTEFNVFIRPQAISVAVAEGLVEVEAEPDATPQVIARIKPGEAITYRNDAVIPEIEAADLARISAWKSSKIYFSSDRLADAVAEYNRYTNQRFQIMDEALAEQMISGIFEVEDLNSFIFSLEQLLDVEVVRDGKQIYISSKKSRLQSKTES